MVIAAITDFSINVIRINNVSSVANHITRTIGPQGGISNSTPDNYYDKQAYTTSSQMNSYISNIMTANNISNWNISIKSNGKTITFNGGTNLGPLPYGTPIEVTLTYNYSYSLLNSFLPSGVQTRTSVRQTVTSFHPRKGEATTIYGKN